MAMRPGEHLMHVRCVKSVLYILLLMRTPTLASSLLVTGTAAVRLAFPFGQRLGCPGKPGRAGANGGGGVRKFGCGAAMPRAGPARSGARERVPRRQERGVGSASESAKEGKEGGKKVQICTTRAGGVGAGPRRGGEPWR